MSQAQEINDELWEPIGKLTLEAYASIIDVPIDSVFAAYLRLCSGCSFPKLAGHMAALGFGTHDKRYWRYRVDQVVHKSGRFIEPTLRFRSTNVLDDERIHEHLRQTALLLVDSFPVSIPRLPTQELRQRYYCFYHKRQCVKFTLLITHEDLCVFVSPEAPGSIHDKTWFHKSLTQFRHSDWELIWGDTAYSGAPHIICKWERPVDDRERAFNDIAQVARTRIERYFSMFSTSFHFFSSKIDWCRDSQSNTFFYVRFACDIRNCSILLRSPKVALVPRNLVWCPCRMSALTDLEKNKRIYTLAKQRKERKKRERGEVDHL